MFLAVAASAGEPTVFHHESGNRFWIAGQLNVIQQRHGKFRSPYSGENSLRSQSESATSRLATLYAGFVITPHHELLVDVESAGGRGISDALGVAGFTNLDVVRNPALGASPYVARLMYHGILPLSSDSETQEANPLSVLPRLPARRIEFRIGKMSTVDVFDVNGSGSDSHLQFTNWTVDNNGAFDYAADTRGYTVGSFAELHEARWSVRAGIFLMPTVANGIRLDKHIRSARGQNVELELRQHRSTVRLLLYDNFAAMGSYRETLARAAPIHQRPDITATRRPGRTKYGAGLNVEGDVGRQVRLFGRAGWNDGRNESYAYTEVDRTLELGGDVAIPHRAHDKAGIAWVDNRISAAHRDYLAAGGLGFLLGDGRLHYGPEIIVEGYYTAHLVSGIFASFDVQRIDHPGYNRDRGPVFVPGARLHIDF